MTQAELYDLLADLALGAEVWIPAPEPNRMMKVVAHARAHGRAALTSRRFQCSAWTAVPAARLGETQTLVRVVRTE